MTKDAPRVWGERRGGQEHRAPKTRTCREGHTACWRQEALLLAYRKHFRKVCWITTNACWSVVDRVCVVFLPNQTEENSSWVETRSFLMSTITLGTYLGTWQVQRWKHSLIKAVTCCPLAHAMAWRGAGHGGEKGSSASPGGRGLYLPGLPRLPSQKSLLSSSCLLWHLRLGLGRCVQAVYLSPGAPCEQKSHIAPHCIPTPGTANAQKRGSTPVWRNKLCDWGVCEFVHSFFSSFLLLGGRHS